MKILDVRQGEQDWHEVKRFHPSASEASALMGASPHKSRMDLLHEKATGEKPQKDDNDFTQRVFEKGHEIEAAARPIIEADLGEDLYPITAVDDDEWLLASFDGATLDNSVVWECKQWNKEKAQKVRDDKVPIDDYWQVIHQLAVNDEAERLIYTVTDGTEAGTVSVEIRVDRDEIQDRILELKRHWSLFEKDLGEYVPPKKPSQGHGLGAELVPVRDFFVDPGDGSPELPQDLDKFQAMVSEILNAIPVKPSDGKQLADADSGAKWCKDMEDRIASVREDLIKASPQLAATVMALDEVRDQARNVRLKAEKAVKTGKDKQKADLEQEIHDRFVRYVSELAGEHAEAALECVGDVITDKPMKNKKTFKGCRDAMEDKLAQERVNVQATVDNVCRNIEALGSIDYRDLWDWPDLLIEDPEHFDDEIEQRKANRDPEVLPESTAREVADAIAGHPAIDRRTANLVAQMLANDQLPGAFLYSQRQSA